MSTVSSSGPSLGLSPAAAHVVLPFAACTAEAWPVVVRELPADVLRPIHQLLRSMKPVPGQQAEGDAHSLSTPHERVLAGLYGIGTSGVQDGLIPWAAWQQARHAPLAEVRRRAWALVTPCHWAMGREHATLTDPAALKLTDAESRQLMADMQGYFTGDGITLHYLEPQCWIAEGQLFKELPTASLDRVLGRSVDSWLPAAKSARELRRLQNEMQMLLYTHPLNEARQQSRGLLPVNSIWFHGTGDLPAELTAEITVTTQPNVQVPRTLAEAALSDNWVAYPQAWAHLANHEITDLLNRQRTGETVRLTLCGERSAQTFETAPRGALSRLSQLFARPNLLAVLEAL